MFLQHIKEATRTAHQQLEQQVDLPARLADPLAYQQLLCLFWGLYQPLETAIAAHSSWYAEHPERRHTPRLSSDLAVLGFGAAGRAALPTCQSLPDLGTASRVYGCCYVIEGSTLGGQIISRMVQQSLGYTASQGCRFFAGYGQQTGPMWKAFGQELQEAATSQQAASEIIAGAHDTFAAFARWFAANERFAS